MAVGTGSEVITVLFSDRLDRVVFHQGVVWQVKTPVSTFYSEVDNVLEKRLTKSFIINVHLVGKV